MITKNYMKMCEKFEKLQESWKPKEGDRYVYKNDPKAGIVLWFEENDYLYCEDMVYLPTVEQLLEILGNYKAQISRVFLSIMVMKKYKYDSIQELVMNAVIEIKYKKYWTGEKWVKAE